MYLSDKQKLKLFKSYPTNVSFTRDNEYLHKTVDILFIANLLLSWKDEYKFLCLYLDNKYNKQYVFTKDCNDYNSFYSNNFYNINTGERVVLKSGKNFICFKQWIKKSTVKKYLQRFFIFRNILKRQIFDSNLSINGIDIVKRGIKFENNLNEISSSLDFKLNEEINLNLLQTKDKKSLTHLICPFCGKVKPIIAHFGYPYWTINLDCITFVSEQNNLICPKCFGLFNTCFVQTND